MLYLMVEIKQLKLVQALARMGSLSAVARSLGYTQPAISQQVRALEKELGTAIVVRDRRGVDLTDAGRILLRHSALVLQSVALAEAEVAAVAGLRTGRVRIAAFPSAAATIVPDTMASMTVEHPGITFTMTQAEPPQALELVLSDECDIAVVFRYDTNDVTDVSIDSDTLMWIPLLDERIHVVLPGGHPSASSDRVELAELAESPWIAGCPSCRGHLVKACAEEGFSPTIAFETDDYVALQNLAARGLGVAILPDLVLAAVHVPGLQTRPLAPDATRHVSAVFATGLGRVPAVRKTLRVMRSVAADLQRRQNGARRTNQDQR